jgi:hypothetical protein
MKVQTQKILFPFEGTRIEHILRGQLFATERIQFSSCPLFNQAGTTVQGLTE